MKCGGLNRRGKKFSEKHKKNLSVSHSRPLWSKQEDQGYMLIKTPSGWIQEHRWIYMIENGLKEIPDGYVVHHIDGNKLNNKIENLIMMTVADHVKLHWSQGDIR